MNPRARQLIVQAAIRHGVDPEVALRVASGEGGIRFGAVGDHGTSFGPFQEHIGGAIPHNIAARGAKAAARWANSAAGIDYAVRGISQFAAGKHGQAGVAAAVRGFERPRADLVAGEIARDMGHNIGSIQNAGNVSFPGAGIGVHAGAPGNGTGMAVRQKAMQLLLNASQNGGQVDPAGLMELARARQQAAALDHLGGMSAKFVHEGGPPNANSKGIVNLAKRYLGTKYVWGGTTPKGFDCSGFVQWLYKQKGVNLPRTTYQQVKHGKPVGRGQLKAGDVVFFEPGAQGPGHEGMYIGNGQFIHAPHTGDVVKISNLADYNNIYVGARRMA